MAFEWMSTDGVFDASSMGDWWEPYDSPSRQECITRTYGQVDAFLMGRKTFEMLEPYWSRLPDQAMGGVAGKLTHTPKYVVSSSSLKSSWGTVARLSKNVGSSVEQLKEQYDRIALIGSATLAEELSRRELMDEYKFLIQPKIMGFGERFFRAKSSATLELVDSTTLEFGVLMLHYRTV